MSELARKFVDSYSQFQLDVPSWYCDPENYRKTIRQYQGEWHVEELQNSSEGLPIELWKWGLGTRKIMAWTQMHGNEPTSSWAFLELLRFMEAHPDEFASLKKEISLYFVPILNPDGARRFTRENAQGVDINRDYHAEQAVETCILKEQIERIQPHLALNLHDQRSIFSVGEKDRPALMSFLSPSYNSAREINDVRRQSMALIGDLSSFLNEWINGYIGRYTDEFYPNAFGDNLQAQQIPTILVESGSGVMDPKRSETRKWTAASLLFLLETKHRKGSTEVYFNIPENRKGLRDVIFREVQVEGLKTLVDVAFQASWKKAGEAIEKEWNVDLIESNIKIRGWNERNFRGKLELPHLQKDQKLGSELVELFQLH